MSEEKHKSFWLTVPGILASAASLTTAMVALLTFLSAQNDKKPAPHTLIADISQCQEIVGNWAWFTGGVVTVGPDGSLLWKYEGTAVPPVSGQWTCTGTKKSHTFMLSWQHGLTDTITLSPDGKNLGGTNLTGAKVSATRRS